eukprot:CAMPEP_0194045408 /NCGR_PEP_ID=MMETSP0009_2-20130614/16762_1 /TAXON_ID=210454 /ORGANISM="Grammatophora oceanica, Strain CCMP 410" /LENGTH=65 /DNA_ID=CAMNT_0038690259 /DNA_START=137 /DNA_END=331 /DNA_ORIENTATION=-
MSKFHYSSPKQSVGLTLHLYDDAPLGLLSWAASFEGDDRESFSASKSLPLRTQQQESHKGRQRRV